MLNKLKNRTVLIAACFTVLCVLVGGFFFVRVLVTKNIDIIPFQSNQKTEKIQNIGSHSSLLAPGSRKQQTHSTLNHGISVSKNPVTSSSATGIDTELPRIGNIALEILDYHEDLKKVMSYHWAVIRPNQLENEAKNWLSKEEILGKWEEILTSRLSEPLSAKQLLLRSYALDALGEAVAWKDNPSRDRAFQALKRVLVLPRVKTQLAEAHGVVASEKREAWTTLKKHLLDVNELEDIKQLAYLNWSQKRELK